MICFSTVPLKGQEWIVMCHFFDDDILYTRTTHPKKLTPKNFT